MNRFLTVAAAAAAITTFSATAADAAVYMGFQFNDGAIVTVDTDASITSYAGAFGDFEVNVYSGTDGVFPQLLGTTGHSRNSAGASNAGKLDIYVTVTDLANMPATFFSSFANNVLPDGWTVTTATYVDGNNGIFDTSTLLSSNTFTSIGTYTDFSGGHSDTGLYSLTARYTIVATSRGEAQSNIAIAAIPEPGAWALMIMGFGAAGAMIRRRKAVFA